MKTEDYNALVERNLDVVDRVLGKQLRVTVWRRIGDAGKTIRELPARWIRIDRDEVRSECVLKLMNAGKQYDPARDFRRFAAAVVANHIRDIRRNRPLLGEGVNDETEYRRDVERQFATFATVPGFAISVAEETAREAWFIDLASHYSNVRVLTEPWDNAVQPDDERAAMEAVADRLRPHLSGTALALLDQLIELGELPPGYGAWRRVQERFGLNADTARKAWERAISRLSEKNIS